MAFDCDSDTLLIQVEQTGSGACHTGSYSCFGADCGEYGVLSSVYETIKDRQASPKDKSYTNYLLNEGIDKICKKVGEESTEAIIAAKNGSREDLIDEISDIAFHLLVLMRVQGIEPGDIRAQLAMRHGISGNLKDKNKKGDF
jgi:phosphoribosyl-ATP pyrophosphohydrolase/phosphoribosyl-AMP cyclohydrolase